MRAAFLPSPLALALVAGLLPLALLLGLLHAGAAAVLGVAALLLVLVVAQGLAAPPTIRVSRELPRQLSVGEPATVRLRVRNDSDQPVALRIADGCPSGLDPEQEVLELDLPAHGEESLQYTIRPTGRGSFAFGATDLLLRRPRGLVEHRVRLELPAEARVHPNMRDLVRYELRSRRNLLQHGGARRTRILGRDGDFERLRDFVAGDDLRHVDWKATARMRRPMTRVYQAERSQNLIILIDGTRLMATRAGSLSKLDYAVNAALMLAWVGLQQGDKVGVGVFDDGLRGYVPPAAGQGQLGRVLDLLFDQQPALRFPRYREAARGILRDNRRRSLIVWLTDLFDGEQGRELLGALRALRGRHLSLVVAMDDPDVHRIAESAPDDDAALFQKVGAAELLDERAALIRKLHAEGARIVDARPAEISGALVDRYLDLKQSGAL